MDRKLFNGLILSYRKEIVEYLKYCYKKIAGIDKVGKGLLFLAIFAVLLWTVMFLTAFVFVDENNLESLGQTGDFFNVATSLFTAFTVCLVAYTIYQQRLEFEQLRNHTQKEAAIDRAIKLIEEWKEMPRTRGSDSLSKEQHKFIKRLYFMRNPKFKYHIDLPLINGFLIDEGVILELEIECVKLKREKEQLNRKIKNESYIAQVIEDRLASHEQSKDYFESMTTYSTDHESDLDESEAPIIDDDVRDSVLSDINDEIVDCDDKINKYKELIDFLEKYS